MDDKDVSLTISKEVVTPIVEAKIKSAVMEAMGGKEDVLEMIMDHLMKTKVDKNGNVSSYDSDNKYTFIDLTLMKQLEEAVKEELQRQIIAASSVIKKALIAKLRTQKGASAVAKALLDSLLGCFENAWRTDMTFNFKLGEQKG